MASDFWKRKKQRDAAALKARVEQRIEERAMEELGPRAVDQPPADDLMQPVTPGDEPEDFDLENVPEDFDAEPAKPDIELDADEVAEALRGAEGGNEGLLKEMLEELREIKELLSEQPARFGR